MANKESQDWIQPTPDVASAVGYHNPKVRKCIGFVHQNSIYNLVDLSSHEEKINKLCTYVVDKQT